MNYFVSYMCLETEKVGNTVIPLNGYITNLRDIRNVEEYISKMEKCGLVSVTFFKEMQEIQDDGAAQVVS